MNKRENSVNGGSDTARRAIIVLLLLYSVFAAVFLIFKGKLIPSPFAELMGVSYASFALKNGLVGTLAAVFFALGVLLSALCATGRLCKKLYVSVPAAVIIAADLVLLLYAFFTWYSFDWSYLISVLLDTALLFCVLSGAISKRKVHKRG